MAHHSSDHDSEMSKGLRRAFGLEAQQVRDLDDLGLGATHKFPQGKLSSDDEGEIKIAVTHDKGKVILAFGKDVSWIGFSPEQANEIADLLKRHADGAAERV